MASQPSTLTEYGYDTASRLQSVNNGTNGVVYSYLANSPLVGQITFTNKGTTRMTTTKQYDYLNRLTSISSTTNSLNNASSSAYAYNAANQRTRANQADGTYWSYEYDSLGQVRSGKKYWSDGTPVAGQQFEYSFDDIGNRKQAKAGGDESGGNLRVAGYTNNALNQLTSRGVPGAVDVMGLGLATNAVTVNSSNTYRKGEYFRKELAVDNSSAALWTNITVAANGETSVTGNAFVPKTAEQFLYDADGNLTNDGRWSYTWDGENRLKAMQSRSDTPGDSWLSLQFGYDYKSRRVTKVVSNWNGAAWTLVISNRFTYDGWNLLAEIRPVTGIPYRTYLWGMDLSGSPQGAGGVGGLLAVVDGSQGANFIAFDGNGNVKSMVRAGNGTVSANYEYGAFGELLRTTGPLATVNPFLFSTKFYDWETGFYYYGYRYYDPGTGRWLSRDPIGEPAVINVYRLMGNNPLSQIDILGLLEYKFRVTTGVRVGYAGKWGQPWYTADGHYSIHDKVARSFVWVVSRNDPGGSCNSIDTFFPSASDPNVARNTSAVILLYLRDCDPGKFRVQINFAVRLTAYGPHGGSKGSVYVVDHGNGPADGSNNIWHDTGTTGHPVQVLGTAFFDAQVNKNWTVVAYYVPTIGLVGDGGGPMSAGVAAGVLEFVNATKE